LHRATLFDSFVELIAQMDYRIDYLFLGFDLQVCFEGFACIAQW